MGITRAQYLMGNNSQENVLAGQVQGVTAGNGININNQGVISVDTAAVSSVIVNLGVAEAFDGVSQTFTLVLYGTATSFTPSPSTNIAVFLGGIPQLPTDAYTVNGARITFDDPPPVGTTFLGISTDII